MSPAPERFIAVDWSGAVDRSAQKKSIWIADWQGEDLYRFQSGIDREKTIEYIESAATETPNLVVGLDFAFSYPAWFLKQQHCSTAREFWRLVGSGKGEEWLREPHEVFWGRGKRPASHSEERAFRGTELLLKSVPGSKAQPKSGFQINGVGSVGTGSLRGICFLDRLHNAGFSIWPFDPPGFPMAIEIYPRVFTGNTVTSKCGARAAHLERPLYTRLSEQVRRDALDSEHAFDALCSVIGMKDHATEFAVLKQATDRDVLLEGQIWSPENKIHHRDTESTEKKPL